jgi:hypothetical protein
MVELKFLNVSLFQKVYAPGVTTYRIQSGKYSPEDAAVLRKALEKMKADLETMINRSVIMPAADGSAFTLPIEFDLGDPNQPAVEIPAPKAKVHVMSNKRAKPTVPSVVSPPAPKERVVIPNLEPYKLAERPPQMPRKSVMSWSQE